MNIIFVEPAFPANQRRFVHALASVGANVYGIGESDEAQLGDDLHGALGGYYRVGSVTNVQQLIDAVRFFQDKVWIDALEATVEAHTMPAAQVARGDEHPRHERPDHLAVPRQAVDEGRAPRRRRAHGRVRCDRLLG